MRYSDIVMDHFMNPRNMGTITDPDGVGRIGDAACGDVIEVWIKVKMTFWTRLSAGSMAARRRSLHAA